MSEKLEKLEDQYRNTLIEHDALQNIINGGQKEREALHLDIDRMQA